jgi:hypothetical protein
VFALVFLVSVGSSRSLARIGGPGHALGGPSIAGDLAMLSLALLLVVMGGIVYALWGSRSWRRRDDEPERVVERPSTAWWEKLLVLATLGELPFPAAVDGRGVVDRVLVLTTITVAAALLALVALAATTVRLPGGFQAALLGTAAAVGLLALPLLLLRRSDA